MFGAVVVADFFWSSAETFSGICVGAAGLSGWGVAPMLAEGADEEAMTDDRNSRGGGDWGEEGKMMRRVQVAVAGLRRAEADCIGAQVSLLCCSFSKCRGQIV